MWFTMGNLAAAGYVATVRRILLRPQFAAEGAYILPLGEFPPLLHRLLKFTLVHAPVVLLLGMEFRHPAHFRLLKWTTPGMICSSGSWMIVCITGMG